MGLILALLFDFTLADVPVEDAGSASGLGTTVQQVGTAVGIAAIGAVRTIRASGAEDRETVAVVRSATLAYDAGLRSARLAALISPASSLAVQGSFLLVLALGGARVARGELTVADLVAFVSEIMTLLPGDVILTGTPEGVGPMVAGQEVSVTIDGIGTLTNPVVDA